MIPEDLERTLVICAGEPVCPLKDKDAVSAQNKGCPWCRRIYLLKDGSEIETGPSQQRH